MPAMFTDEDAADDFPLHHGALSLSFVGTIGRRQSSHVERLPDADALLRWLRRSGILECRSGTKVSRDNYRDGLELRELLARLAGCVADDEKPVAKDVRHLNDFVAARYETPALRVRSAEGRDRLEIRPSNNVSKALGELAADAVRVFAKHGQKHRLVRCQLDECGAVLLSPANRALRLWCSPERCANVSKVRAFRARRMK